MNSSNQSTPQKRGPGRPPMKPSISTTTSGGSNNSSPFMSTSEFANSLPPHLHKPMQELVRDLRERKLSPQDFYSRSKDLLGANLYETLLNSMKQNASRINRNPIMNTSNTNMGSFLNPNIILSNVNNPTINNNEDSNSAALHDVMHYAGIDLKAESDLILREQQQQSAFSSEGYTGQVDPRLEPSYFFNINKLKAILAHSSKQYGMDSLSPQTINALALVLLTKLSDVLIKLVKYSRHRCDLPKRFYKIKVENDPKKQLWLLEQILTAPPEQKKEMIDNDEVNNKTNNNNEDANMDERKMKKKQPVIVHDESAIKTKITNITASAATGLKVKSWMTNSSRNEDESLKQSPDNKQQEIISDEKSEETNRFNIGQAPSASPLTERDLVERYLNRSIIVKDLIRILEEDEGLKEVCPIILHHLYHHQ